ncbi:hypothetical protein [Haloglomus halophilum]|uniref:hypothetical protein n=1 Tax=Haloglomus halophilum TaxID=2962672 RepID=UPI0020CA1C58|nr:hypothetical protein [Haloglomus halophilum]
MSPRSSSEATATSHDDGDAGPATPTSLDSDGAFSTGQLLLMLTLVLLTVAYFVTLVV